MAAKITLTGATDKTVAVSLKRSSAPTADQGARLAAAIASLSQRTTSLETEMAAIRDLQSEFDSLESAIMIPSSLRRRVELVPLIQKESAELHSLMAAVRVASDQANALISELCRADFKATLFQVAGVQFAAFAKDFAEAQSAARESRAAHALEDFLMRPLHSESEGAEKILAQGLERLAVLNALSANTLVWTFTGAVIPQPSTPSAAVTSAVVEGSAQVGGLAEVRI